MINNLIKPLVSVIVPVYNSEEYLDECVNSIITQSYRNIEIVIVDDGSTDNSKNIIERYSEIDNRIITFYKSNTGVSDTRNVGISLSHGDWLLFVDADDYIETNMILNIIEHLTGNDSPIIITDFFSLVNDKNLVKHFFDYDETHIFRGNELINIIKSCIDPHAYGVVLKETNVGVPWGKLYNKNYLIENNCYFDYRLTNMEDTLFNVLAFLKTNSVMYIPIPYYHYRIRHNSSVLKPDGYYIKNCKIFCEEINKLIIQFDLKDKLDEVMKYKRFCLFFECIRKSIIPLNCTKSEKLVCIAELSRDNILNGSFQENILKWYSKTQILYSILVSLKMYGALYNLLNLFSFIKKRAKINR